jgi:hypothetical protein
MKSLFIISLPRSMSSKLHRLCCSALNLQNPSWTSDGEILNVDRSVLMLGRASHCLKYTRADSEAIFHPTKKFLSQLVSKEDYCYKDVTQPFIVSEWLRENPDINVVKIIPNLCHVAFAMMQRQWLYPTAAAGHNGDMLGMMITGLRRAAAAIDAVPGEAVHYDDLVFSFEPLRQALSRLYPQIDIDTIAQDRGFGQYRDQVLDRRKQDTYQELQRATERYSV